MALSAQYELIEEYFRQHIRSSPSQEELASLLHISTRQLNRTLNQIFGMSFKEHLAWTRINMAKDFLLYSDMTVSQIADRIGYSCVGSLNKIFKEQIGMSPMAFRNLCRHTTEN